MNDRVNRIAWLAAALLAWLWAWKHLAIEWRTNEQYQYGFGVPALALYLAWRRWPGPSGALQSSWLWVISLVCGWLALALGELLCWHDPIWRLTGALLAAGASLVSVAAFLRLGGAALLRRELFPLCFAWVAVPWPIPLELAITQNLLHVVTTLTTTLLGILGIAAVQHGNALELSTGLLGIDDACSGIRSLQAALMAALFLGEYFSLSASRRVLLLVVGTLLSFGCNCARVLGLALVLHFRGPAALLRFHDAAGAAATAGTFLGVVLLAIACRRSRPETIRARQRPEPVPGWDGAAVCVACAAIPALIWAWFYHLGAIDARPAERPQWALARPDPASDWKTEPLEPRPGERAGLQFSSWEGFRFQSPQGWSGQIIHLRWDDGKSMPSLAFYHTPALCMPWVGWTEVGRPARLSLPLHGQPVPFMAYRFSQDGIGVIVLQGLSSGGVNGYHVIDPAHLEDRWHRLGTLWKAPLRQVNEELLVYLPDFGGDQVRVEETMAILEPLLSPK